MRRHALGLIGLAFLVACLALFIGSESIVGRRAMMASISMRMGIVLCLTWLAYPQLQSLGQQMPKWAWALTIGALLLFVVSTKLFPISLMMLAIVGLNRFVAWLKRPPTR